MGKDSIAPSAARFADTTIIDPTKGQVLMQKMQHRLINASISCTGLLQHFVGHLVIGAVDIKGQWLGLTVVT